MHLTTIQVVSTLLDQSSGRMEYVHWKGASVGHSIHDLHLLNYALPPTLFLHQILLKPLTKASLI